MPRKILKKSHFSLFGTTWKIHFVDKLERETLTGETDLVNNIIYIATLREDGSPIPEETIQITFFHELMHSIFDTGLYTSCDEDEPLVEWCARCLFSLKKQKII